jgi:hypothetical protein
MPNDDENRRDAWTAFALGVLGGAIAAPTLLSFAGLQPLGLIAVVGAIRVRPRPFAAAGLLISIGVTWIALFARAATACGEPPCGSDPTPWIVAALVILAGGGALLMVGISRVRAGSS